MEMNSQWGTLLQHPVSARQLGKPPDSYVCGFLSPFTEITSQ